MHEAFMNLSEIGLDVSFQRMTFTAAAAGSSASTWTPRSSKPKSSTNSQNEPESVIRSAKSPQAPCVEKSTSAKASPAASRSSRASDESVMEEIAHNLPITEGLERMMTILKRVGYKTAILSGGFTYFGNYLRQKYGFDYVYANELEIENGKLTGRYVGKSSTDDARRNPPPALSVRVDQHRTVRGRRRRGERPPDAQPAGLGIAFHAKPKVKATARQAISTIGLDGILYFLGLKDSRIEA